MIRFEQKGEVAIITLDNGRLNIFDQAMHEALYRAFLRFERAPELKVAVLTCLPGMSFSAGDNLHTMNDDLGDKLDWESLVMQTPRTKPVVGAVRGHCIAQGLVYLLSLTDIRFATRDASFGFPEIRHGMGGAAVVSGLSQYVPQVVAMRMVLTGQPIDADSAVRYGLVNELVDPDALLDVALAEATKIGAHDMAALRIEMAAIARNHGLSRSETFAFLNQMWNGTSKHGQ